MYTDEVDSRLFNADDSVVNDADEDMRKNVLSSAITDKYRGNEQ